MPSGVKSFIARYRSDSGGRTSTRRTYTLGRYGPLTVDQARKSAKAVVGTAANGAGPGAKRNAKRSEMLVSDLCKLYEKRGCVVQRGKRRGEPMKPLSKHYTLSRIQHHIVPQFGDPSNEVEYRGLVAMDAMSKIKDGVRYPAVLAMTGITDPRVASLARCQVCRAVAERVHGWSGPITRRLRCGPRGWLHTAAG